MNPQVFSEAMMLIIMVHPKKTKNMSPLFVEITSLDIMMLLQPRHNCLIIASTRGFKSTICAAVTPGGKGFIFSITPGIIRITDRWKFPTGVVGGKLFCQA